MKKFSLNKFITAFAILSVIVLTGCGGGSDGVPATGASALVALDQNGSLPIINRDNTVTGTDVNTNEREEWVVRASLYFTIYLILTVGAFFYGANPKIEIFKGGRLMLPEYASVKPKLEILFRALTVGAGIWGFVIFVLPLGKDAAFLHGGGEPVSISGEVTYKAAFFGLWFLDQSVMLNGEVDSINKSYELMFSSMPLRKGDSFELRVLPNSHMIVSAKLLQRGK